MAFKEWRGTNWSSIVPNAHFDSGNGETMSNCGDLDLRIRLELLAVAGDKNMLRQCSFPQVLWGRFG